MSEFHCYSNGADTYIAISVKEAIKEWEDLTGESIDWYDPDEWYQEDDDHELSIWFEKDILEYMQKNNDFKIPEDAINLEPPDDGMARFKATAGQWAKANPKAGFLCSTEY